MVQEGQDFLWPGMRKNYEVKITEVGEGDPGSGLGRGVGEGEVKLSQTPTGLEEETVGMNVIETDTLRENIDPMAIQRRRSEPAREADSAMDAELTSDPLTWASDPRHFDFPGVDTGPTFRESEGGDFDTEGFLDSLF